MRHCDGFHQLRTASKAENTAEVGLHKALKNHPARSMNVSEAALFYVPIFEYTSHYIQNCTIRRDKTSSNSSHARSHTRSILSSLPLTSLRTHQDRMRAASAALMRSDAFKASGGRDHFWATSAFSARGYTLAARMGKLSGLLSCTTVGRYKAGPLSRSSRVGDCVIELPYQASLHATREGTELTFAQPAGNELKIQNISSTLPMTTQPQASKQVMLFFAGSLDVCCTGRMVRCAISKVYAASINMSDVIIRPTGNGPCARSALNASKPLENPERASNRYVAVDLVQRTAREMSTSLWCLCPAGDTCVTSRLYSAIAAGCLPIVLCDQLNGAFPGIVKYS